MDRYGYIILILILSLIIYPYINVYPSPDGFRLANVVWGSLDNPQKVYPGSTDVVLIIEVVNEYNFTLESVTGNLSLPSGFTDINGNPYSTAVGIVKTDSDVRRYVNAGETFTLTYTININNSVSPGEHYASLNLTYTYLESGNLVTGSYILNNITLKVSDFPVFKFTLKRISWNVGGEEVSATPASRGLTLDVDIFNNSTDSIDTLNAYLNLTYPFKPDVVKYSTQNINAESRFTLTFNDISIDSDATPGAYYENLTLVYTFRGYGNAVKEYKDILNITLIIDPAVEAGIKFVKVYWRNNVKVYPGSRSVYLEAEFENLGNYQLKDIIAYIRLPNGFSNQSGGNIIKVTYSPLVDYGDFFTIDIGPLYIYKYQPAGVYYLNVTITSLAVVDNSNLLAKENIIIPAIVNSYKYEFDIMSIEWSYGGNPAIALPGARDIVLSIKIAYRGVEDISGLEPHLILPSGFRIKSISQYPQTVTSSTIFTLSFVIDIDRNVSPKSYTSTLIIKYTVSPSNQDTVKEYIVDIPVNIASGKSIDSQIDIVNVYWGVNTPRYVYPASQNNPLNIVLANRGGYDVSSLILSINKSPKGFYVYPSNVSVTTLLNGGGFAETRLYINISKYVKPGEYTLSLRISYQIRIYGSYLNRNINRNITVYVSRPIYPEPYINVISYRWANGYKVYPGTDESSLSVSFVNNAMYPISAININVTPPVGISVVTGYNSFYIEGPIQSWNTFNINIALNVSKNVKPGYHRLKLKISYIVESGGDGILFNNIQYIHIYISQLKGLRYISYMWVGQSPGPGSAGATLMLIFRDDKIDAMKGLYATIKLPKGFISTDTGTNTFNVTPASGASLQNIISNYRSLGKVYLPSSTQVSPGDYIVVPMNLIISKNLTTGKYYAYVTFNFLDQWGSIHEYKLRCYFNLPGSTTYLEVVENESYLIVGEKEANVSIVFKNPGSAPIYDVYIGVGSYSQAIVFSSSLKYIPILKPGDKIVLTWRAAVNPSTSITGSLPAIVSISYIDPSGYRNSLNQTVILYVIGIAKLKIIDLEVNPSPVLSGGEFSVSATIVNIGTDTAKYSEVYLVGNDIKTSPDSYTYLGDIDVGYQIPFTLYAEMNKYSGNTTIYLVINYYNLYHEKFTIKYPIKIAVEKYVKTTAKTTTLESFIRDYWRLVIVAAVVSFLIITGLLIYKVTRSARLGRS